MAHNLLSDGPGTDQRNGEDHYAKRQYGRPRVPAKPDADMIQEFETQVLWTLNDMRRSSDQLREEEHFTNRHTLNELRQRGVTDPKFTALDYVDPSQKEGHAKLKICQGWSARNVQIAGAQLHHMVFETGQDFFTFKGMGDKVENRRLSRVLRNVARELLKRGNFRKGIDVEICFSTAAYGSAELKADLSTESQFVRQQDATYREVVSDQGLNINPVVEALEGSGFKARPQRPWKSLRPQFKLFPLQDLWVSDYNQRGSERQDGIWWAINNMTTDRIAGAVKQVHPVTGQEVGRWIPDNFDRLEKATWEKIAPPDPYMHDNSSSDTRKRTTSLPKFALIEYQGTLPWAMWIKQGIFCEKLFYHYGFDRFFPNIRWRDNDEKKKRQVAQLLGRIKVWNASYAGGYDPNRVSDIGEFLLELEPSRFRKARNTLWDFRFFLDREKFLGQSIAERGEQLEKLGDMVMNAEAHVRDYNSDPARIYRRNKLENQDDFDDLFAKGNNIPVNEGVQRVEEVFSVVRLEPMHDFISFMQSVQAQYDDSTGIPPVQRGVSGQNRSRTLGEAQMNRQTSSGLLRWIGISMSQRLAEMVKWMVSEAFHFLGRDEFAEMAREVSGLQGADIDHILDEVENGEFEVVGTLAGNIDPVAQATVIQRGLQVAPDVINRALAIRTAFDAAQVPHADELVPESRELLEPKEEHELMRDGTLISVQSGDDHIRHIEEHTEFAIQLVNLQGLPPGWTIQEFGEVAKQIHRHIQNHQREADMAVAAQQQQIAAAQQAQAGRNAPQSAGGGRPSDLETNTNPAQGNELGQLVSDQGARQGIIEPS